MTLDDVKSRVERVREAAGDPECAHSDEDCLYREVLEHIASGNCVDLLDARNIATEALKTQELDFPRWCA